MNLFVYVQAVKEKNNIESRIIEPHVIYSPGEGAFTYVYIFVYPMSKRKI
jgi:hypothetical protein